MQGYRAGSAKVASLPSAGFAKKLKEKFAITVEVDPSKGADCSRLLNGIRELKAAGADFIDVGDNPLAKVRMSPIAFSYLIQQKVGLETIIHFTCRDRNLLALQSELLGAYALGIRNVLALTGDEIEIGDCPDAKGIYDVNVVGLIKLVKALNSGKDFSGNNLLDATNFFIGTGANPTNGLKIELQKLNAKIEAGANFIMTQPLFESGRLEEFAKKAPKVPLIIGVFPLASKKQALFLKRNVPGIFIPEEVIERIGKAGESEAQKVGVEIAIEVLNEAKKYASGGYIIPPFNKPEIACEVIAGLGS